MFATDAWRGTDSDVSIRSARTSRISRAWSVVSSSNLTEGNTLRETKRIAAEPRIWNAEAGAWSAIWDSDALKHPQIVLEVILLELNHPHPPALHRCPAAGEGTSKPLSDA